MKKIISVFFIVALLFTLVGCSLAYDGNAKVGNFDVYYSDFYKDAFLGGYYWDGSKEGMNIVIPEEYNGYTVTELGGYHGRGVPTAFGVVIDEKSHYPEVYEWVTASQKAVSKDCEVVYYTFNIHISKNIEKIEFHNLDSFVLGEDLSGNEKIAIIPLYKFTCDQDNKNFYVKDGKLYDKKNDSLIENINYYDFEIEKE